MSAVVEAKVRVPEAASAPPNELLQPIYSLRSVKRIFARTGGKRPEQDGGGIEIGSLDLPANKIVAILGRSGSGKSTLLNLLGGFIEPEAMVPGESKFKLTLSPDRKNNPREYDLLDKKENILRKAAGLIGFVFQHAHLLKSVPVASNVALPQAIAGSVDTRLIHELCQPGGTLGLDEKVSPDARARTLSGGEAQRVALGRALLLKEVEVILADEPTASLDPELGADIMAEVAAWQKDGNGAKPRTVIWVTHNIDQVALFADCVVVLNGGRLAEVRRGPGLNDGALVWPAENPRDPKVLEAWLRPKPEHRTPSQDAVTKVNLRRDELLKKAPYRPGVCGGGKTYSSRDVLWRVAFAEIFNHGLVDKHTPRWLSGMTSLNFEASQRGALRWLWRVLFFVMAAALGFAIWKGGELRFGVPQHALPAWVPDLVLGVGSALVAAFLYWKMFWRKFGRGGQVSAFLLLLLFLAAAVKSYDVVNVMFAKRLAAPDLSHIVVAPTIFSRAENNETMLQNLAEKQSEAYKIWEKSEYRWHPVWHRLAHWTGRFWNAPAEEPPAKFFFPRFEKVQLTVGARTNVASIRPTETCGKKIPDGPEMIALDPAEPVLGQLEYLTGATLNSLKPGAAPSLADGFRIPKEGLHGIVVTKSFLKKKLGYADGEIVDPYLCVQLFPSGEEDKGWRVVKILSVVSALPNDSGSAYDVALDIGFYANANRSDNDPLYHKIAFYINPERLERDLKFFDLLNERGAAGMKAESGLNKIRSAMSAGNAARAFAEGAAGATLLLGVVLIALLANAYLTENERSLCVMRAFGLSYGQTLQLTVLQLFIIFLFAFAALTVLLAGAWPYAAGELARATEIDAGLLRFQPKDLALVGGLFLVILVSSSAWVVLSWSVRTRWIAERLQQVG